MGADNADLESIRDSEGAWRAGCAGGALAVKESAAPTAKRPSTGVYRPLFTR
jgi:hypothetical protein